MCNKLSLGKCILHIYTCVCVRVFTSVYTPGYDAELEWLSIIVLTPWTPAPPCCQFEMSMVAGVVLAKKPKKIQILEPLLSDSPPF